MEHSIPSPEQLTLFTRIQMDKKTIVVTGGHGFIGSRFIKHVYENTDFNIINIDKNTYAADPERIPKNIRIDRERYMSVGMCITSDFNGIALPIRQKMLAAKYVVNFAAESHVDNSIEDGTPFVRSNIEGVFNLLNFFKDSKDFINHGKFIQISTDEVYGDMCDLRGNQSADESFSLRPSSYYSASKASADLLVQSAARTFGISYLITRSCNNYGPNQDPEKFLPKVYKCIQEGEEIPVYGDGEQIREWIHVDDNVRLIAKLTLSMETGVFNIGTGHQLTNNQIIDRIGEISNKTVFTKNVEDRLGHDKKYSLDCRKLNHPFYLAAERFDSFLTNNYS